MPFYSHFADLQVAFYAKGVKSAVAMPEQPPLGVTYIQGYDQGSTAYPILAIARDPRIGGYTVPADYTAHPDATKWPDHVFVGVSQTNADNRVLHLYMKLPGALVSDDVFNDELRVNVTSYTRMDRATVALPIVGATDGTASTPVSNSIVAVTVDDPGSGYLTPSGVMPILTVSAPNGGGTQAVITVTNLKLVSAAVSAPGSGYVLGSVVTLAGGTFSTAATLTATSATLASLDLNAAGTGYVVGDAITLAGGTGTTPATITVSTIKLVSVALNAAGAGYTTAGTITLAGGTSTTKAIVTIATLKLVTVLINAGGANYTAGDTVELDSGTASTKAVVTVDTVDGGGAILTFTVTTPGDYSVTSATHTSTATSGIGTGATFQAASYGVLTFTITTEGNYTVGSTTFTQFSATGGGTGATFQTGVFGVNTFAITSPGQYIAPAASSFTAASTTGIGIGVSFYNPGYTITQLTVTNAGAYTVIPSSPNAVTTGGSGSGLTLNLSFGIGNVSIFNAGTTYYYPPTITPSYGSASISATMSAPQALSSQTAYYTAAARLKTELAAVKKHTWSSMPLPPTRVEYHSKSYPLPDIFTYISPWTVPGYEGFYARPPFPGVNYTTIANGVSTNPARVVISYSNGPSGSVPETWRVITPGVQSRIFPIGQNTIHNAIIQAETGPSGTLINEITPASTPASYIRGQTLIIDASERPSEGNFYEKRVMTIT